MTRIFWDTIFLISGSLFTLGAGPSNSTVVKAPKSSTSSSAATGSASITTSTIATTTTNIPPVKRPEPGNATATEARLSIVTSSTAALNSSASSSAVPATTAATTTNIPAVKKFVAAAVRSHFADCPDSHRHFCFHGTCRFLILDETPACVCHPGFVGMRCEHADLLAVVATNHRQQTVATVLILCVIGSVLIMVMCTLLHCWWRQGRRRRAHHYITQKHGVSCYPPESVV